MTLRDASRRLMPVLVLAGSVAMLAACHTVGDTVSGVGTGMGQDLRATGNFIGGGPAKPKTPPTATSSYAPGTQTTAPQAAGPYTPQPTQ